MYVYILKYDKIIVNKITNDILNIKLTKGTKITNKELKRWLIKNYTYTEF